MRDDGRVGEAVADHGGNRRERRKAETRGRLLLAARELFADRGVDATRINEITEAADVGFGSFYNHFASKDAIVDAVMEASVSEIAAAISSTTEALTDPAEIVSVAHRTTIAQALADPDLGWILIRLELSHDLITRTFGPFAIRDIERGVAAGRFVVDDEATALTTSGGALLATVRALLGAGGERDPAVAAVHHAAAVLRLLGIPPAEAAEIASRPLPTGSHTGTNRPRSAA
jgi:AcrR family transcriptional regulator